MQAPSNPLRFLPLVKSIALQTRDTIAPHVDVELLVERGRIALTESLTQYRSRQGLTLRNYLTYKIRGAIYDGLSGHSWPNNESWLHYLFAKKSNELLLHFHLSAEGTIKRSIKAEEEEVLHLLRLLAVIAMIVFGAERIVGLKRSIHLLDARQKDFIKHYYEQDLTMERAAEKIGLSGPVSFRFHLQILEKLAAELAANNELNV
ncbi:hypothetical protein L0222_18045 [bacterium]|nr:hypothetical protein [bacterium]MCI0604182.1 hypothetical protein [bacterium]